MIHLAVRFGWIALSVFAVCAPSVFGEDTSERADAPPVASELPPLEALSDREWDRVDRSVDHGLSFLLKQQQPDGSFPSSIGGQPAVTSLAAMAFLSAGYKPGEGPYGDVLSNAVDFVLSCQEADGLITLDKLKFSNRASIVWERRPHSATYNHAISGVMLGEVYGHCDPATASRVKPAIEAALIFARQHQKRAPSYLSDKGGWRYLHRPSYRRALSDLSVTGWFVMFYRSARNAGFDVPAAHVDEAVAFVQRCHNPETGAFFYGPEDKRDQHISRGMTGAGLLTLTLAGHHDDATARSAKQWLLDHPFNEYNAWVGGHDRFHYGAYYCSQAMYMVGGDDWAKFYRELATTLVDNQRVDGGWEPESRYNDRNFGRSYTTALSVLSLTPPYQLLPIYQR